MIREEEPHFSQLATKEMVAFFERVRAEVPGFIAASLVDLRSGTTLAAVSERADFDLATANVFNCETVKQETNGLQAFASQSTLENISLTLNDQIHILRIVDAGAAFIYLAADRSATNLGFANYALDRHVSKVR